MTPIVEKSFISKQTLKGSQTGVLVAALLLTHLASAGLEHYMYRLESVLAVAVAIVAHKALLTLYSFVSFLVLSPFTLQETAVHNVGRDM